MVCCRHIPDFARKARSPFRRWVATDYYDGPRSGFIECEACGRVHAFTMLDWDDGQNLRLFALAPVRRHSFEELAPWLPSDHPCLVIPPTGSPQLMAVLDAFSSSTGAVKMVVATRNLLGRLEAIRFVDGDRSDIHRLEDLDLSREADAESLDEGSDP